MDTNSRPLLGCANNIPGMGGVFVVTTIEENEVDSEFVCDTQVNSTVYDIPIHKEFDLIDKSNEKSV
jgi:hypothetical protein